MFYLRLTTKFLQCMVKANKGQYDSNMPQSVKQQLNAGKHLTFLKLSMKISLLEINFNENVD